MSTNSSCYSWIKKDTALNEPCIELKNIDTNHCHQCGYYVDLQTKDWITIDYNLDADIGTGNSTTNTFCRSCFALLIGKISQKAVNEALSDCERARKRAKKIIE